MDKLIIDGIEIDPNPQKTVLEVARELGIDIPTLCYHKSLTPYGACRFCVVETIWKGRSKLQTACTFPAWEGEVRTNSEPVKKARKLILELMLAEAPASEELQELGKKYDVNAKRFTVVEKKKDNKCILCGLCVRLCKDVLNIGALGFEDRGFRRVITTPFNEKSETCSTCGACEYICPTGAIKTKDLSDQKINPNYSEFEEGLDKRGAIYTPFPQAVPNKPVIDVDRCMQFKNDACRICEMVCQPDAIDFKQKEEFIEEDVGAVVVATGFDLYDPLNLKEYGYGTIPDVVTSIQFERILSASGPTVGEVKRPSDGATPKRIVFIQCAGSRDKENHLEYCSKICCMYTAKHALLYKHRVHEGEPIIFYIDVRTSGKSYEESYNRVTDESTTYIRGKVSKVYKDNGKIIVLGADTLSGKQVEVEADMVVLALGIIPKQGGEELVRRLKIQCDANAFLSEAHPKLKPVESQTAGIFLAGVAQGPKDIPEVVAQASGAASKAIGILVQEKIAFEPTIAGVDDTLCSGCSICVGVCPYNARELDREENIVKVVEALCQGCGSCSSACPSGAAQQRNLVDRQIEKMVTASLEEK